MTGSILDRVESGEVPVRPLKLLIYGVEGVGKSTLAAGAPSPVFADAERGTLGLNVKRVHLNSWEDLLAMVVALTQSDHRYQTLVLDTLDSIERLLTDYVRLMNSADSIEDVGGGYGKGWSAVAQQWARFLALLDKMQAERGIHIVALAHADAAKFGDPDGADYNRWSLRINKKGANAWKGWCEDMLFATRDVHSGKKDKGKGKGGARVLFTRWTPGREAKNRHNLPDRLPLSWQALNDALMANVGRVTEQDEQREKDRLKQSVGEVDLTKPEPGPPPRPMTAQEGEAYDESPGHRELAAEGAKGPGGGGPPEPDIHDVETEHGEPDRADEPTEPFRGECDTVRILSAELRSLGKPIVADKSLDHMAEVGTNKSALLALITRQREVIAEAKKAAAHERELAARNEAAQQPPVGSAAESAGHRTSDGFEAPF